MRDEVQSSRAETVSQKPEWVVEYAELRQLVKKEGLLAKQPAYYAFKFLSTLGLLALSLGLLVAVQDFRLQLLNAAFLAFVCCQMSFLVHDAGHRQIFHAAWKNDVTGIFYTNLLLGMSYSYWRDSHNRHHGNPNQLDLDPDIDISALAFTEEQARSKQGLLRWIAKYQAYLLMPMLFFDALRRRKEAIEFLLRKKPSHLLPEALLLGVHYVGGFGWLFARLGFWRGMLFILVQQALYGLFMASAFATNHMGMPILDKNSQLDFLRRQVLTTRNVLPHPLTDFWYGALNYQIEHHLFPNMSRNKVSKAQRIVKPFCEAHSIPYSQTGAFQSYRETLRYLHKVSAALRNPERPGALGRTRRRGSDESTAR